MNYQSYAALEAGAPLQTIPLELPSLAHDDVRIAVEYCGICHSDISMIDNAWGISQYPLVPGHEIIGKVVEVGSQVKTHAVGDTVGVGWHSRYCNKCCECLNGDQNLCANHQATIVGHYGGFSDMVQAQATSVIKIPKGLDLAASAPLLCGGITVFNPLLQIPVRPTERVGIIGIGGLGHIALQFLKAWGCDVVAFSTHLDKKDEITAWGANEVIDSNNPKAISACKPLDVIISTVNVPLDWSAYLGQLKPRGRLHFLGAVLKPVEVPAMLLIQQQRSVSGSPVGSPDNIEKMLQFSARHHIKPVIETYPMHKVNEALDHLRQGKIRYRAVLTNRH
jgi:uncharacterized zinc-type alcohol dehydrogenase-like protein